MADASCTGPSVDEHNMDSKANTEEKTLESKDLALQRGANDSKPKPRPNNLPDVTQRTPADDIKSISVAPVWGLNKPLIRSCR